MKKYLMLLFVIAMALFIAQTNFARNERSFDDADSLDVTVDSVDVICLDSIEEVKDEPEDEQTLYEINKQLTFDNFVELIKNFSNEELAKKCGLVLVEEDNHDRERYYCYGRGVVDSKLDSPASEHACLLTISDNDGAKLAYLLFKDSGDSEYFFKRAKEYGLLIQEGAYFKRYFIPKEKLPNGCIIVNDANDYLAEIDGPSDSSGWYMYFFSF